MNFLNSFIQIDTSRLACSSDITDSQKVTVISTLRFNIRRLSSVSHFKKQPNETLHKANENHYQITDAQIVIMSHVTHS